MNPISNTLSGNDFNQLTYPLVLLQQDVADGRLPPQFPMMLWQNQAIRYQTYWDWHTGEILEQVIGQTEQGEDVYRFPLKANPVRDFARKHAALLFGEVPDTPTPLVKTLVSPKPILGEPTADQKELSGFLAEFVNEVWQQSNGRSLQLENGQISQFLGGSVFQVAYVPWRSDLLIPIQIKNVYPNLFLPVWSADSYYDLLECWVTYRIDPGVAQLQWGMEVDGRMPAVYTEHWTRQRYSVTINGKPLVATYPDGTTLSYDNVPNPFGFVPFVYIPRLREGSYYGSSLVPDIAGLALEFNARVADEGDAMRDTAHQTYVGSNITGEVRTRKLGDTGANFVDIGNTSPLNDSVPSLTALDPPHWDAAYSAHKNFLWSQMTRAASLGPIAFGEDEGSQRSALTLAFRMWPSTTIAKAQRTFWTDGLIQVARYILRMASIKKISIKSRLVPRDFERQVTIIPQWLPMIPRDREALVNEIILRLQSRAVSIERAVQAFGDSPDEQEEIENIIHWATLLAKIDAMGKPATGVKTDLVSPVASSGLRDSAPE